MTDFKLRFSVSDLTLKKKNHVIISTKTIQFFELADGCEMFKGNSNIVTDLSVT